MIVQAMVAVTSKILSIVSQGVVQLSWSLMLPEKFCKELENSKSKSKGMGLEDKCGLPPNDVFINYRTTTVPGLVLTFQTKS